MLKKIKMRECCKDFFDAEGLQGIENEPMQFCPFCGRRLTNKEFSYYNKKIGKLKPKVKRKKYFVGDKRDIL